MRRSNAQYVILSNASGDEYTSIESLSSSTFDRGELLGATYALDEEGLIDIQEESETSYSLTNEGTEYAQDGLPEIRLYEYLEEEGEIEVNEVDKVLDEESVADIARTNFMRKGLGTINNGIITCKSDITVEDDEQVALQKLRSDKNSDDLDDNVLNGLQRRSLVSTVEEKTVRVRLTESGLEVDSANEETETVGELSSELITSGEWKDVSFTPYNVSASGEEYYGGRSHILRTVADRVRDVLVSMGFQEMTGPNADADFWINDALFMPQDHPARTHWDRFTLDVPEAEGIDNNLMNRVQSVHENGLDEDSDGYRTNWSKDMARTVALRGHTTSLSMRYLSGDIEPPARYFSVDKVYRNDTLDSTHLLEFYQIEGWVMADNVSVRDLMGTFESFYEQFGITDIEFKPHYNPYTEPSFELFGRHPETGELIEIGNSGIFREEVLSPLGIEHDVMAWGLALERLVMLMYGFEDIRDLHGTASDINLLRNTEVKYNANR